MGHAHNLIDENKSNSIIAKLVIPLIIKCANDLNHCNIRNKITRNDLVNSKCSRCSQLKIWDYSVRCNNILEF